MSNIKLTTQAGQTLRVSFITFSDGSETCTVPPLPPIGDSTLRIHVRIEDATRDLVRLCLVKDSLDRMVVQNYLNIKIALSMSYMPQARADRQFAPGQPHPLAVYARIINSLNFDSVYVIDSHSDVTEALVHNLDETKQPVVLKANLRAIRNHMPEFTLCAPDLGAAKKMFDVAKLNGFAEYIQAIKIRDVLTGNIVKCDIIGDVTAENVLIVDDIADGGASFKFLAMKLKERGVKTVGLLVSHAIFPNGLEHMFPAIDYIYAYNIVGKNLTQKAIDSYNSQSYQLKNQ